MSSRNVRKSLAALALATALALPLAHPAAAAGSAPVRPATAVSV